MSCDQAWAVLESQQGNVDLARQLFKCAVKADPASEASWLVSHPSRSAAVAPFFLFSFCRSCT